MLEQGHFKELESLLRMLENLKPAAAEGKGGAPAHKGKRGKGRSGVADAPMAQEEGDDEMASQDDEGSEEEEAAEGGDGEVEDDDEEEEGGGGGGRAASKGGEAAAGGVRRQTFLFSATLMLPPAAREANAKRVARHKVAGGHSTMDKLLRMLRFRNTLKVGDTATPTTPSSPCAFRAQSTAQSTASTEPRPRSSALRAHSAQSVHRSAHRTRARAHAYRWSTSRARSWWRTASSSGSSRAAPTRRTRACTCCCARAARPRA